MPYDEHLAERVRALLPAGVEERRMFGSLGFMVGGRLGCSVTAEGLLIRVAPEKMDELSFHPHASPMTMGNRVMKGFLHVDLVGLQDDAALDAWITRALDVVSSLGPPVQRKGRAKR